MSYNAAMYFTDKILNSGAVSESKGRVGEAGVRQGKGDAASIHHLVGCPIHREIFRRSFFRTPRHRLATVLYPRCPKMKTTRHWIP